MISYLLTFHSGLPRWSSGKESACQCKRCGRCGFNHWVRKIPWRRNGNPLQYSCPENSVDRGAWQVTVHGVAKSWIQLSTGRKKDTRIKRDGLNSFVPPRPSLQTHTCTYSHTLTLYWFNSLRKTALIGSQSWAWSPSLMLYSKCAGCSYSIHAVNWCLLHTVLFHQTLLLLSHFSRVQLLAAHQAPPSMGFSRQEYWSGVPLPPDSELL